MSVANILGVDGRIKAQYLPGGSANNYVDNPMAENLDGGGFDMTNIDDIQAKGYTVLDSAGTTQAKFTFGTDEDGDTGVLLSATNPALDTNLIVDGVIKGAGLSGTSVDVGTYVNIPAGIASGLAFFSPMNQLKVSYTDGVGLGLTAAGGTANFAAEDITATGTIQTGLLAVTVSEYDFIGLKSLVSGSGTVATTQIAANDIVFLTPQCQNVGGTALYYTVTVNAGVGFTIQSKVLATGVANITDTSTIGFVVIRAA